MKCEDGKLPTAWTIKPLGTMCEVVRGGSPRPIMNYLTTSPTGVNWLKIGDVVETDKYFTRAAERIKLEGTTKSRKVERGDLLLSNSMSFGRAFITLIDGYIHDGWLRLRSDERVLDKEYLYYFLLSPFAQNQFKSVATGSVVANLKSETVKALEVLLPPLPEQKRIAAILSSLDDKIELNNKINANLEQQAQAVFTAWFAEAKPSVSFVSLVRVLGGGTPRTSVAEFWEGEIPFFTPKDVYGVYTLETEKSLTDDGLAHCNSCLFPTNTVFVTARGTVGKLTLAGRPMAMNQSCYALLGQEGYGQYFVYHLAQRVITHLKHKANGAVFDAIVTRDFESEFVPDIKPSEAANFELKVKPLYEAILRNYEENCRLSALRDMLLQRLLSGACVIS